MSHRAPRTRSPGSSRTPQAGGRPGCAGSCGPAPRASGCSTSRATTTWGSPPTPGWSTARCVPRATWGAGSTGSRLVTGSTALHAELEAELAAFCGADVALVFSSGYAANLGVLTALAGPDALIVSDAANHASLVDACRLSRARVVVAPRDDPAAVDAALAARTETAGARRHREREQRGRRARPAARRCTRSAGARGALLVVDEAHGLGVAGPGGRGPAGRGRARRCGRRGRHRDAVQGAGQPGRRGARPGRGHRAPCRHGALVHLRHRPRAGVAWARRSPPCGCCAPSRSVPRRCCGPRRRSRPPPACPPRRPRWSRWCSATRRAPLRRRAACAERGRAGRAASGRRRCRRARAGCG